MNDPYCLIRKSIRKGHLDRDCYGMYNVITERRD